MQDSTSSLSTSTCSSSNSFLSLFKRASHEIKETSVDCTEATSEASVRSTTYYSPLHGIVRDGFFPLNGHQMEVSKENRALFLKEIQGEQIHLITQDGLSLDAVWSPSKNPKTSPTAVIFHPNACQFDNLNEFASWYHKRNINVLLFHIRGYPGSEGNVKKDGELGFYLDGEAAIRYALEVQKVDRTRLFGHGYSLGGSLCMAMGYFFNLPTTLDHTFTSAEAVMKNVAQSSVSLPDFVTRGVAGGVFPVGQKDSIPDDKRLPNSKPLKTDSLDSLSKMKNSSAPFFVMYGSYDELMPTKFADDFYECRYGLPPKETSPMERKAYFEHKNSLLAEIQGGHWGPFMYSEDAVRKYERYLVQNGLMDKRYMSC